MTYYSEMLSIQKKNKKWHLLIMNMPHATSKALILAIISRNMEVSSASYTLRLCNLTTVIPFDRHWWNRLHSLSGQGIPMELATWISRRVFRFQSCQRPRNRKTLHHSQQVCPRITLLLDNLGVDTSGALYNRFWFHGVSSTSSSLWRPLP